MRIWLSTLLIIIITTYNGGWIILLLGEYILKYESASKVYFGRVCLLLPFSFLSRKEAFRKLIMMFPENCI